MNDHHVPQKPSARFFTAPIATFAAILALGMLLLASNRESAMAAVKAQNSVPTDTIQAPYVECCRNEIFANLRSGPSASDYPIVGKLTMGERVSATGRTKGGTWIQIRYPGVNGGIAWVSADYVTVIYGTGLDLPVVDAPPTPEPQNQATVDPTFAAQFSYNLPTRLPTFTPATPQASFTARPADLGGGGGLAPGVLILLLLTAGIIIGLFATVFGRQ